jgi:hypothetical protein
MPHRRAAFLRPWIAMACVAAGACAPVGPYHGPNPAPGATRATRDAIARADSGATPRRSLVADGAARAAAQAPATVIVYGDNRGGFRMQYHVTEYRAVTRMFSSGLGGFAKGLLFTPVLLVESILPTLDGPRDLVTAFTRNTRAGGEGRVLDAMKPFLPVDLVISTGDIVTDGRRGRLWESFVWRHAGLRSANLYLAAPGNHERLYDATAAASWDAAIGPPPEPACRWFRADLDGAGARFVFLDSDMIADVHGNYRDTLWSARADAQLDFAEQALSSPARWKFVVLHHPPVSTGHYERDWAANHPGDPAPARRARLLEMCARHGVTAVLAGHEHLYYRLFVADSAGAGFWQIITGGGGAPPYPIEPGALERAIADPLPGGLRVVKTSAFGRTVFHFCRITFPAGEGPLHMEVFGARPGGKVERIDQVDLAAPPAPREPAS